MGNVISGLGVHEYQGHGRDRKEGKENHDTIIPNQLKKTKNIITPEYKKYLEETLKNGN